MKIKEILKVQNLGLYKNFVWDDIITWIKYPCQDFL